MPRIDAGTSIGAVALRVRDLERVRAFYVNALGLREVADGGGPSVADDGSPPENPHVRLGAPGSDRALIELIGDPAAPERRRRSTGLFHLAILVPGRAELAASLRTLLGAGWRLSGASDHLVSEALYLDDPEGNGIEIYRDRPQEEWHHDAAGELQMATLPLDLDDLLTKADPGDGAGDAVGAGDRRASDGQAATPASVGLTAGAEIAAGTRIGHVHLNVAELEDIERFYAGALGFEVTVRSYPGALFVGAGGYHHHIGLNTWRGPGAPPPPQGSLGLEHFEILLPSPEAVDQAADRLERAQFSTEQLSHDVAGVRDPSGNRVLLRAGPP